MTAREIALQTVRDVFPARDAHGPERGAQEAIEYRAGKAQADARDRAFATMLAFGSIKMRRLLDFYLAPYVGARKEPLPPAIAEILRLAVYELRFASTGQHAVVSEWVGMAKRYGHRGTAGLVNAVLRSFLRDDPPPPAAPAFEDEDEYLGTAFSFPTWLVRQWRACFGGDRLRAILEGCNAPAQTAVTINRMRMTREQAAQWFEERGAQAKASTFASDSVLVADAALAFNEERSSSGVFWVQSESSAAVVDVLNPQPGERVADACSGRGSKALQIAARLGGDGMLVCVERDQRKLDALLERAQQGGLAMATVTGDATRPILETQFDRVLLDAPCSGTGIVGRHPEARWRKRPDDGERLASTQAALLESLAGRVFEGGALVYAVCSTDPRETTEVVEPFLRANNWRRGLIPASLAEFETDAGDVVIAPGIGGRDGFYIARLERGA